MSRAPLVVKFHYDVGSHKLNGGNMPKLFKSLLIKLSFVQRQIDQEHSKVSKDWLKLLRLKKLRLKIKDRINLISTKQSANSRRTTLPA